MFISLKKHYEKIEYLQEMHKYEMSLRGKALLQARQEAVNWRIKYEQAILTPEAKVDTEEAFSRGVASQKKKFAAWLMTTAQQLENDANPSND